MHAYQTLSYNNGYLNLWTWVEGQVYALNFLFLLWILTIALLLAFKGYLILYSWLLSQIHSLNTIFLLENAILKILTTIKRLFTAKICSKVNYMHILFYCLKWPYWAEGEIIRLVRLDLLFKREKKMWWKILLIFEL